MSHAKTQIRQAFIDLLMNNTVAGANVLDRRKLPINILPVIGVYSASEMIDKTEGQQSSLQFRTITVLVRAQIRYTNELEDEIDALQSTIETLILADKFLGNLAYANELTEVNSDIDSSGEIEIGILQMTFEVQVLTDEGFPEMCLN